MVRHVLQRGIQCRNSFMCVNFFFPFFKRGNINVLLPHAQYELIWTKSETREKKIQRYTEESNVSMIQHCDEEINFFHYQTDLIAFTFFCLTDFSSFSSLMSVCVFWYICFRSLVYSNFIYIVSEDNCKFLQWFSIDVLKTHSFFY